MTYRIVIRHQAEPHRWPYFRSDAFFSLENAKFWAKSMNDTIDIDFEIFIEDNHGNIVETY